MLLRAICLLLLKQIVEFETVTCFGGPEYFRKSMTNTAHSNQMGLHISQEMCHVCNLLHKKD